jgi:PKD repeat protein
MGRSLFSRRTFASLTASLLLAACTVHKQETPSLTGPSGLGTDLVITASPSVLNQDGASASLVQIQVYGSNGQAKSNVSMRVEIIVDGVITDFGRLSARNVVTDTNGRASVTYTAPSPVLGITSDVLVDIGVTPGESDFGNATTRFVRIRLVPPGVIGPPQSPFVPDFTPPAATVGNPATFTATATGSSSSAQVATFFWDFGDGDTAVGQTVQHTFDRPGTFVVTLALIDTLGRTNSVQRGVTVGQGQLPTATFFASPANPIIDQTINFNGSGSTAEPGHTIVDYSWNFGDGTLGSGPLTTHSYSQSGTYTVTLKVTDDVGRKSALVSQQVTVGTDEPTASFTMTPNPASGTTGSTVTVFFDASASQAKGGRTIVSYAWTFSNGGPTSGRTTSHGFVAPGTYQITLTVTDSAGKTGTATQTLVVTGT